jgi:UDP-glucuronate 4-epimerase
VDDVVAGIVRAMERSTGYHVWNLGGANTITLAELVSKIADRLGVPARVKRLPLQPGDVDRTWADIALARRELDWEPRIDIDRGLELFLDWFEKTPARRKAEEKGS